MSDRELSKLLRLKIKTYDPSINWPK